MRPWLTPSILAAALAGVAAADQDWPQIRGPQRDGVTAGDGLARSWGDGGPPELWRRPIGAGFASLAAVADRVYTAAADGDDEVALCFDAASGEPCWRTVIGGRFANSFGDGPRATPTVDGRRVFVASGSARLLALDAGTGAILWQTDLAATFGAEVPRFGFSVSPLIDGPSVLMEVGGGEGRPAVVALDKANGAVRWGALEGPASYSSPIVAELAGIRQVLVSRRSGQEVVGLGDEGAVLWRHPGARAAIVMPIVLPDDRVFLSSSDDDYGGVMLRVARDGAKDWTVEELWSNRRMRNHFNNAVAVGGYLFGFDNATLRCLSLEDGTERWARRGFGKGSLLAAGDRLYVLADDGTLVLAAADPGGFRELGRVQATTGRAWTAPALARGRIFVRDHDEIVAFDVSAPTADGAPGATP